MSSIYKQSHIGFDVKINARVLPISSGLLEYIRFWHGIAFLELYHCPGCTYTSLVGLSGKVLILCKYFASENMLQTSRETDIKYFNLNIHGNRYWHHFQLLIWRCSYLLFINCGNCDYLPFRTHQHDASEQIGIDTIDIYDHLQFSATVNVIIFGSNIICTHQALI